MFFIYACTHTHIYLICKQVSLDSSLNAHRDQAWSWAGARTGGRNSVQVSHVCSMNPVAWIITSAAQDPHKQETAVKSGSEGGTQTLPEGQGHLNCQA